jgi:hypothetical protein
MNISDTLMQQDAVIQYYVLHIYLVFHGVQTGSGAHPAYFSPGTGGTFTEYKATGTATQCRGQEWWSYTYTPPHGFMAWCLIN